MKRIILLISLVSIYFIPTNSYSSNLDSIFLAPVLEELMYKNYQTIKSNQDVGINTDIKSLMNMIYDSGFDPDAVAGDKPDEIINRIQEVLSPNMLVMYFINNSHNMYDKEKKILYNRIKHLYRDLKGINFINCSEKEFINHYNIALHTISNNLQKLGVTNLLIGNRESAGCPELSEHIAQLDYTIKEIKKIIKDSGLDGIVANINGDMEYLSAKRNARQHNVAMMDLWVLSIAGAMAYESDPFPNKEYKSIIDKGMNYATSGMGFSNIEQCMTFTVKKLSQAEKQ